MVDGGEDREGDPTLVVSLDEIRTDFCDRTSLDLEDCDDFCGGDGTGYDEERCGDAMVCGVLGRLSAGE